MSKVIFECVELTKCYHDSSVQVDVLKQLNLSINQGERIAIVGPSGSGKSTLLHLLGGLDNPTAGDVLIQNVSWRSLSEKKRCQFRNQQLGFIYQFHHLLPEFSALENIAMPLLLNNVNSIQAKKQALMMLDNVGLSHRARHKPAQLSGGERQRIAIARALVHQPQCVLADEPTGNLDNATAAYVFELMLDLNKNLNTALIIVTHDKLLAARMDRLLTIQNGHLI
jgi:lipoprotein-releasing system ATP-binding protein